MKFPINKIAAFTSAAALAIITLSDASALSVELPTTHTVSAHHTDTHSERALNTLPATASIAVAQVELGRFTPMPHSHESRWDQMGARTGRSVVRLKPNAYLQTVPEVPFFGHDSRNTLDEIRLATLDSGHTHLLVYGDGEDARRNSFARRALSDLGLTNTAFPALHAGADSKAVLIDARTGHILSATTARRTDAHASTLSDAIAAMLVKL